MITRGGALLALALSIAAGCGGGQTQGAAFDEGWTNDNGAGIGAFQQRFAQTKVPVGADVAIGVVDKQTIVGAPLDGGAPWTYSHQLDGRPAVAGTVVVGLGAGELFALDAKSGKPIWKRNAGGLLRGAGDDGKTTVVSLMSTTGRGTTVLAVSHEGEVVRQVEDEAAIGVPAVVDGYAFLPWQGQYVTVYDLVEGKEAARVLLRTQVSRAFTEGGAIFFGEAGVTRLDDQIRLGPANKASTVTLPARELPGSPRWLPPGIDIPPVQSGAHDKIRLYARPAASGAPSIEGGRFAATYFRIAVGFDAQSGAIGWAYAHDADFLDGAAYAGGFALCDQKGNVTLLDAKSGGVAGKIALGKPLSSCVVQADGLTKAPVTGGPGLAEQLSKVVMMPEAEHVMIQKLLLREMAGLQDELVTKTLIDLASNPLTPPMLLEDSRKSLAARRNGVEYMLAALQKHYDFLTDVLRPPPVGPLADALAAMKEKRAAPLLGSHLNDPADTLDDAQRTAAALVQLAEKGETTALTVFFAHYRGAADDEMTTNAVVSTAQALVKLGASDVVAGALKDPYTSETVRTRISSIVKTPDKPKSGDGTQKKPEPEKKPAEKKPSEAKAGDKN